MPGVEQDAQDQARLLLAQIRLADDDTEEALELLDGISARAQAGPVYLSTHGFVLMNAGKPAEAVASLRQAVAADPEDPDMHYWLGQALERDRRRRPARAPTMLKVLELDQADHDSEGHEHEPLTAEIEEDLRGQFEGVLEELPEPVLKLIASAPITVQARATAEQVRAGADPRGAVALPRAARRPTTTRPASGASCSCATLLLDEIDDDDDIPELLLVSSIDELRRFFRLEGLEMATGEE